MGATKNTADKKGAAAAKGKTKKAAAAKVTKRLPATKISKNTKATQSTKKASKLVHSDHAYSYDDEEGMPSIPYKDDDPDDSDYVDDKDAEVVEFAIKETKYKKMYGDLEEEGGRYAVLLKNGEWVDEELHEEEDPKHQTCVLDEEESHEVVKV